MATREEIREGVIDGVESIFLNNELRPPIEEGKMREWLGREVDLHIINHLHSQGVVIKVRDGELPSFSDFIGSENDDVIKQVLSAVEFRYKEAGFTAVEPLIKEFI